MKVAIGRMRFDRWKVNYRSNSRRNGSFVERSDPAIEGQLPFDREIRRGVEGRSITVPSTVGPVGQLPYWRWELFEASLTADEVNYRRRRRYRSLE